MRRLIAEQAKQVAEGELLDAIRARLTYRYFESWIDAPGDQRERVEILRDVCDEIRSVANELRSENDSE